MESTDKFTDKEYKQWFSDYCHASGTRKAHGDPERLRRDLQLLLELRVYLDSKLDNSSFFTINEEGFHGDTNYLYELTQLINLVPKFTEEQKKKFAQKVTEEIEFIEKKCKKESEPNTLEERLTVALGLGSQELYDVNEVNGDKYKLMMAKMRAQNVQNDENFQLEISGKTITNESVHALVEEHYIKKGYKLAHSMGSTMKAFFFRHPEKETQLTVNVSIFSHTEIMVSVTSQ